MAKCGYTVKCIAHMFKSSYKTHHIAGKPRHIPTRTYTNTVHCTSKYNRKNK